LLFTALKTSISYGEIKITIEFDTHLVCDSVRNYSFHKAGNQPKADAPCFFYAHLPNQQFNNLIQETSLYPGADYLCK
jgi:hypothetical protein